MARLPMAVDWANNVVVPKHKNKKALFIAIPQYPRTIVAVKLALAGSTAAAELAHNRTATIPGALTRIRPFNPASRPLGHPGTTPLPTLAPGRANVWSAEQAPAGTDGKSSVAEPVRYVGTTAASTAMVVCPPDCTVMMPVPASRLVELSHPLRSTPPPASHTPIVAVQVYSGMEFAGNPVPLGIATHAPEQLSDKAVWTVRFPAESA
jgi:hypothetical protein